MTLSLAAIAEAIGATTPNHADETVSGWSIDSRTVNPGDCFFALRGPKTTVTITSGTFSKRALLSPS